MEKYNADGTINMNYVDDRIKQEKENLEKLSAALNEIKAERASRNQAGSFLLSFDFPKNFWYNINIDNKSIHASYKGTKYN